MGEFFVSERVVHRILSLSRLGLLTGVGAALGLVLVGVAFLIVALSLSQRTSLITVLSSTGYPAITIGVPDVTTVSEVQTFVSEAMARTFTFSYGEFLDAASMKAWMRKVRPFFTRKYFPRFIRGLKQSGFFEEAVRRRVAVFAQVLPPVQVTPQNRRVFRVRFRLVRLESTARGDVRRELAYQGVVVRVGRTPRNPWGLAFDFLREEAAGEPSMLSPAP